MDLAIGARKLLTELVAAEQLEVRRVEIVARDLVKLCASLGRPPSGRELEEWLDEHAQVTGVYGSTNLLDELIDRHLAPPPAEDQITAAHHPELEAQLGTATTIEPFTVYADWLQEHGDPFGELIVLALAATGGDAEAARFDRHLRRFETYLLGGKFGERVTLHWRNGFVRAIEDGSSAFPPDAWRQLLGGRACELLESITLRHAVTNTIEDAIADTAAPSLCALVLTDAAVNGLPPRLVQRPLRSLTIATDRRFQLTSDVLPAGLERLELRTRDLAAVPASVIAVRELEVELDPRAVDALMIVRLPRVERLILHLVAATASSVCELVQTLDPPALRSLALHGDGVVPVLAAIAKLSIAKRLTALGLVDAALGDDDLVGLAAPLRAFAALETLDLDRNELSRDGLAAAHQLAATVTSQRQHRPGTASERRVRRFADSRLQAAEAIADPALWKRAFVDGDLRWARFRGEAEYELYVSSDLARYGCSCPSSIQPCKHVAALALIGERMTLPAASSNRIEERVGRRLRDVLQDSIDTLG